MPSFPKIETLIIGAGPAGLMAAHYLAKHGIPATILEARDRIGGRACTLRTGVELGAEFVHGELPLTLSLLQEAGLSYTATGGEWVQLRGGESGEAFGADEWPLLMRKLAALKEDMSLQDFLERHFNDDRYAALKDQAIGYAEGYDTADTTRASAKALYAEWSGHEEEQYRIDRGYAALMDYLAEQAKRAGSRILLSHPVTELEATADGSTIVTAGGTIFHASRVMVALPLGVLQSAAAQAFGLQPDYTQALGTLGFGDVVKFVLQFREPFWEDQYPDLGFLLASGAVPTWWTQAPSPSAILTGWMAGRAAKRHAGMDNRALQRIAIDSLAKTFSRPEKEIEALLVEAHIVNWSAEPFTLGSYAYATVGGAAARDVLGRPMGGRIFFAGEYMYDGPAMGTVEAALWSGREAAAQILAC